MNEQADPIDAAIKVLKRVAQRQKKKTDWEKVDRDLRAVFVQLALANSTEVRGLMGETYRRVGVPDASITEARQLLTAAKNAFRAAKRLPTVLSSFAVKTYGDAGRSSIPWEAMRAYTDAVTELEECLDTLEDTFKETLSKAGKTKGMKGPLLERVIGTPIEHFLQCLIVLWREATGRKALGEDFEDIANWLFVAAGNRREIGVLKRKIENAKRRGEIAQTPWTHMTEVMYELQKRPHGHRGRR
jgi:hypothetical protein